jgi:hypothetical protein
LSGPGKCYLIEPLSNTSFKGENGMKKLVTFVFAIVLGASLSLAQTGGNTGGSTGQTGGAKTADSGKKGHKGGKKGHKGGKKGKKGSGGQTTPAPK